MIKRYLEDFAVRQLFKTGRKRVDKDDIFAFAKAYGPPLFRLTTTHRRSSFRSLLMARRRNYLRICARFMCVMVDRCDPKRSVGGSPSRTDEGPYFNSSCAPRNNRYRI